MLIVKRIENNPVKSNCFIIHIPGKRHTIIIDPGSLDLTEIIDYIKNKNLLPELIILTHEHFDHIWGVNSLRGIFNCKLFTSYECSNAIVNPKKNLSIFYNQIGFSCAKADQTFSDTTFDLIWHDRKIEFFKTPGHANGSICILLDSCLFTGDTLLENTKIVTKLPGGDNEKLKESTKLIYPLKKKFKKIYPGHGNYFTLEELNFV